MANSLAEGFIRQTYSGLSGIHHAVIPVNYAGVPVQGVEPDIVQKDGTEIPAITGFATFLTPYREIFETETLFGLAEAYAVDPDTEERNFLYSWNVAANGTSDNDSVELGIATMTFKTAKGGIIRLTAMESVFPVNQKFNAPYTGIADLLALSNYMVSNASIVIGRDNAYAFTPIATTVKTSDALRKRVGL